MDSEDYVIFHQDDLLLFAFGAFEDMRRNEEFVDFEITLENRSSLKGHRIVLAAAIPFFRRMFGDETGEMTLGEIDPETLESVINFAYTGKIEITFENVQSLLSASQRLQLTRVHEACWEFLKKRLRSNNVLAIRHLAEDFGCTTVMDVIDRYIKQNFEDLSNSESFLNFPFLHLREIIMNRDIEVKSEEKMLDAVLRWIKASPFERCSLLPELLGFIHLRKIKLNYLIEKISTEKLVQSSPQCRNMIEEVINYHFLSDENPEFSRSSVKSIETPYETKRQHVKSTDNADKHRMFSVCTTANKTCVLLFDPESGTLQNLSTYTKVHASKVIAVSNLIYIFGAKEIVSFDVNTQKWNTVISHHNGVSFSGCTSHLNKIYFFGGMQNTSSSVRCFNTQLLMWEKQSTMSDCFQDPGVASLEDSIYVTGGRYRADIYNAVQRYNPKMKTWREISPMLYKRCDHGCSSSKGKIYVFGGLFHSPLCSGEVYDPLTDEWNFISSLKEPGFDFSVISDGGKLCAVDRLRSSEGTRNINVYDQEKDEWKLDVLFVSDDFDRVFLASARSGERAVPKDRDGESKNGTSKYKSSPTLGAHKTTT